MTDEGGFLRFNPDIFFSDLCNHLAGRGDTLRSLAVMVAIERWVQMEAAALLDKNRSRYGIHGGDSAYPTWWVTCEYQGVDIWLANAAAGAGVAIELKAVHNNKNFYPKLAELRTDLTPEQKDVPTDVPHVQRFGLFVATYARYAKTTDSGRQVTTLRTSRRAAFVPKDDFLREIVRGLADDHPWYGEAARLEPLCDMARLVDLDGAPYIEPGHGSGVWLGIVTASS
jgi:hypothetical protein